jgi:hypothetical protein
MTFQASPIAGALPSNTRRAFTTRITMYKKISQLCQNPSERMVACTCTPTSCALADLLLKSAKNEGQSSSIIILSRALRSRRRRSIMIKFVAKRVSIGTHMERFGEKRRNMACEAWCFLTNVQILRAFSIDLLIHNCLPQSSNNRSRQCAAHP